MLISFEGVEGCGKTTQAKLLYKYLKNKGYKVKLTYEPGGCKISNQIRDILLNPNNKNMTPLTELLLYEAARNQHITEVIKPALERGYIIICDRFSDSTIVYQGYARKINQKLIGIINKFVADKLKPDLTILLDIAPEISLLRVKTKTRFEQEELSFHKKIREGFLKLAQKEPARIKIFDATLPPDEIHNRIIKLCYNRRLFRPEI